MARIRTIVVLAALGACATPAFEGGRWIDLTHDFASDTIYWPTASGFELVVDQKGPTEAGYWYEANTIRAAEHGGTHLDAPVHFAEQRLTTEQIPLERLLGPAFVIDVRDAVAADRDYRIRVADVLAWEIDHCRLPPGAIVLFCTGFAAHWPDPARYLGTAERGVEATFRLSFPGLHPACARWLAGERAVAAVGIDTASIDHGKSRLFRAHRELFAHDVPVFENVANLDRLPPCGAFVVALPMKIRGGSGGPLRIVAWVPD